MTDKKKTPTKGKKTEYPRHTRLTPGGTLLPIDPDTGNIDMDKLTDEQRAEVDNATLKLKQAIKQLYPADFFEKLQETTKAIKGAIITDEVRDLLRDMKEDLRDQLDLFIELDDLEPYIKAELTKPEYAGKTFDDLLQHTPIELLELRRDPNSYIYKVFEAAKAAKAEADAIKEAQQAGRDSRKAAKVKAEEQNAVMNIRQGKYFIFSDSELWDAFAPGRICKMGTLSRDYIDETGLVRKTRFEAGEIENVNALDISYKALTLLNSILANTVENIHKEFIKNGEVRFYVKGVLDAFTDDPRTLHDGQITLDRKTAGVLYLEKQFEPLQSYIGTTLNGSRYSVFNYIGYDFETDTMIVQLPYMYELWKSTQANYFKAQENKQRAIEQNKKPKKDDNTPLFINALFKGKAYTADEITLEIAAYITNTLWQAGAGKNKTTQLFYKTITKECPRFKEKLEEIENDDTLKNPSARYNTELKKIAKAIDLIQDPNKCDAQKHFEFTEITPSTIITNSKGDLIKFKLIPPTKKALNEKLIIKWNRIKSAELDEN